MQELNCRQIRTLPTVAKRRRVSACNGHYELVQGAGVKAKSVTTCPDSSGNNLPLLYVSALIIFVRVEKDSPEIQELFNPDLVQPTIILKFTFKHLKFLRFKPREVIVLYKVFIGDFKSGWSKFYVSYRTQLNFTCELK